MNIEIKGKRIVVAGVPYYIGQQVDFTQRDHLGKQGEIKKVICDDTKNPEKAVFNVELQSGVVVELGFTHIYPIVKTLAEWRASACNNIDDYLYPGDIVDEKMYEYFLNVLPPRHNRKDYLQMMTPYDDAKNDNGDFYPVFMTFEASPGFWRYIGHCFDNGHEHQSDLFLTLYVKPIIESRYNAKGEG